MPPTSSTLLPRANVLGVGISAVNLPQAVHYVDEFLQRRERGYVCVTGVHGVMEARRDPAFRQILNRAVLCTPDGMPTVWIGHLQRHKKMARVYGPDFMRELCRLSVDRGYRHFLYGGNVGVAAKLKRRFEEAIPGIQIVGTYTPPFRPLSWREEDELIALIERLRPDVVWVGLSTPKQERFMAEHSGRLSASLLIGVGAAFDIHAGLLAEAPAWMQRRGLQWLHRLGQEPRRLWRRYLTNNPHFLWEIALQLLGARKFELEPR